MNEFGIELRTQQARRSEHVSRALAALLAVRDNELENLLFVALESRPGAHDIAQKVERRLDGGA